MLCPYCHGTVYRTRKTSLGHWLAAMLTFTAGVVVFFIVPILGCFVGPMVCTLAPFLAFGGKVLRCGNCKAVLSSA